MWKILVIFVVIFCSRESSAHGVASSGDQRLRALLALNQFSGRLDTQCREDVKNVLDLALSEDLSANQMLESWSTFSTNHTHYNSYDFGDYLQCTRLKIDSATRTQYCLVQYRYTPAASASIIRVQPNASFMNVQWSDLDERFGGAVCLPQSCSAVDVKAIVDGFFNGTVLVRADDYDQRAFCKKASDGFDVNIFIVLTFIVHALVIAIVLASTYLDHYHPSPNKTQTFGQQAIECFSLLRTYKDLMNFNGEKSSIACINGIKAMSVFIIMLYHSIQFRVFYPFRDGAQLAAWIDGSFLKFVGPLTIPVDAFLLVSGALATKCILRDLKSGRFSLLRLYVQRYFRITPVAISVMLFSILTSELLYHLVPYSYRGDISDGCRKHWLAMLLHVQTYTNPDELCVPYIWYLSVDWQMFLIAPLLIYVAFKFPFKKLISGAFAMLVVAFVLARFITVTEYGFKPEDFAVYHSIKSSIEYMLYYPTHIRGLPFVIGMMLGYFLQTEEKLNIVNKTLTKTILQFSLILSVVFILVYPIPLEHYSSLISPHFELFLFTFGKLLWSLAIATIIFVCFHGSGGVVNWLLSHRIWTPVSKMSLSFYLMSAGITYILIAQQKTPQDIETGWYFVLAYLLDVSVSTFQAIVIYFFIEAPFTQFGRIISRKL